LYLKGFDVILHHRANILSAANRPYYCFFLIKPFPDKQMAT
jgi:hypothetical protein